MFEIKRKERLNDTVTLMEIEAPFVAKKALPGQFIIVRAREDSERIPLTIVNADKETGWVTIIFQLVGASTMELDKLNEGESVANFVGPLGKPSELLDLKKVVVVGGGVGCAIAYPIVKWLHNHGAKVTSIVGFRNKDLVILEKEFRGVSDEFILTSDDGSAGKKGLVTDSLREVLANDKYDRVIAIGPLVMMKFVTQVSQKFNTKVVVSMNPIMIDGTGMCGCCRLSVNGKMKFACVDGPDFDGNEVDFDEAIKRNQFYKEFENKEREKSCNLYKKEVN